MAIPTHHIRPPSKSTQHNKIPFSSDTFTPDFLHLYSSSPLTRKPRNLWRSVRGSAEGSSSRRNGIVGSVVLLLIRSILRVGLSLVLGRMRHLSRLSLGVVRVVIRWWRVGGRSLGRRTSRRL